MSTTPRGHVRCDKCGRHKRERAHGWATFHGKHWCPNGACRGAYIEARTAPKRKGPRRSVPGIGAILGKMTMQEAANLARGIDPER
jgi:hypothetical protein